MSLILDADTIGEHFLRWKIVCPEGGIYGEQLINYKQRLSLYLLSNTHNAHFDTLIFIYTVPGIGQPHLLSDTEGQMNGQKADRQKCRINIAR